MSDLTPYDTGERAEPRPWVNPDGSAGSDGSRQAEPDDYGRVDFDDDSGSTLATVRVERRSGRHVLVVELHDEDVQIEGAP